MKRLAAYLSLTLIALMLLPSLAACGGNESLTTESASAETTATEPLSSATTEETKESAATSAPQISTTEKATDAEETTAGTSSVTASDGSETESLTETESETDTEAPTSELSTEEPLPKLDCEDGAMIEGADRLANKVNAYYTDGKRLGFVTENINMKITYSTDMLAERKVTSLTDKNGNKYIENTMDVFVKMKDGGTYYASKTKNSAKVSQFAGLNIFRYGYYYYDVRFEDQSFVNEIKIIDEKSLNIKSIESELGVKAKYGSSGLHCELTGDSVDPQVVFSGISFNTEDYNYIAITMKSDLPATGEADCQFFIKTTEGGGYKNVSFDTVNDGEYHTYYVYLGNIANYKGTLNTLRLDFSMSYSSGGGTIDISELKAIKADVGGAPQDLGLARVFHTYSDKLHQELQLAAKNTTKGIEEVGMITEIAADTVDKLVVKDANGLHYSLAEADLTTAEYLGFDIKGAGIFGYILPYGCTDKLSVTLENGIYTIIQSATPDGGTISKSEAGTNNENDFRMGQRLYTDKNHSFEAFILEATIERNPLDEKKFNVYEDSTAAEYLGYDPIRGCYTFSLAGTTFSSAYFDYPNRHYKLRFAIKGDDYNRTIYVMSTTRPYGHLEGAVLLNEDGMNIPVPLQVSKNFLGDGEANLFNIDDEAYGETIMPLFLEADEKQSYTILNLYQNWGKYPLKQLSSVQYFVPYYHLSTGVTETNCLKPWYFTSLARDPWNLPDHRAWSAPFWHTIPGHSGGSQPQHTLGGAHYFLEYVNSDGEKIVTENTKNTIVSSGPTYAELLSDYISDDGKIKISYTHLEMPQTDENRTYYEIEYEILGDLVIGDFRTDLSFYAVMDHQDMNYTQIGYLDENNESQVISVSNTKENKYYPLGKNCPYISYFNNPKSDNYVNVSFLVYSSEFIIGGEKCDAPFVLVERGVDDMKKIALSLDLGKVELKAGDRFTINAIIMPWGSQLSDYSGDAPDKNVRDVRENSLLDPFRGEAIADCETVESVFLPKFRTTNGKSAEFKISGGENNVAVRIYGFHKLTAPKIYEKIDGEWVEYVVSSKNSSDKSGYFHHYDGYGAHYDGDGTFSYSFVTTLEGDEERIFRIEAEEDFSRWPKEYIDTSNTLNVYKDAQNLYDSASIVSRFNSVELLEDGAYVRLTPKDTVLEAYFNAYSGDKVTGQYLILKYRIPSTNVLKKDHIQIFVGTKNTSPTGGDEFTPVLSTSGEWCVAIFDLTKAGIANGFVANKDGTYSVKYIRLDPFNGKTPSTEAFDIAYMAIVDDLAKVALLEEELETATLYEGNKRTPIDTATGEIQDVNVTYIHPDSGYKTSTVAYATHLDMINGTGGSSASYPKRGGNSTSGIDTFEFNNTTMLGSYLIFSGWTVAEGGIEKYVWSVDGKTWHDAELIGRELGNASNDHLNNASSWFLEGYQFVDAENSLINAIYQSPTGLGDGTKGLGADLSDYVGQKVNVTFAAVPKSDTSSLCLIAYVTGVEVLPSANYKISSVIYATHLDMINGKGDGDAASYSLRGGNSSRGIDTFEFNNTTMNGSQLVFSGWTVAEGGIDKYAWSADGGVTWHDAELCGIETLGKASSAHLGVASGSFLGGYQFKDTEASLINALYQSGTGLGNNTTGLSADLSDYVGQTVDVMFAAVPTAEPDAYCLIALVKGVEVVTE